MGIFEGIKLGGRRERAAQQGGKGFAERVKQLADEAGIKIQRIADDIAHAVFAVPNGRTQLLVLRYVGDLAGKPVVRITSPVADLSENPLDGDAAIRLLKAAGNVKIGGFAIEGNHLVVHQGMILPELTGAELRDMASTLAVFADDAEQNLTGTDHF